MAVLIATLAFAGAWGVLLYRLRREPFVALRSWLDDVEAFWASQLDAFKAHVERKRKDGRS